ncbi:TRAP transporter substrate-binding protein DctP [Anaerobacillus sp. MEB173]|uniref:TRAP transporter substrate-binding protein DctP n=1 Tax=Anaerobacillus sp. MEB173 TaxID=3383345 RepID=UPI003F92E2B7
MKKHLQLLLILTIGLIITSGCVDRQAGSNQVDGATNEGDETINLRLSSGLSMKSGAMEGFFVPWMDRVEEETDGKVQFEVFTSGELVPVTEELRALKDGTIDIAAPIYTPYDSQRFPLSEVTMLPLTNSDAKIAAQAYANLMKSDVILKDRKTFSELEFEANGIKALPTNIAEKAVISTVDHPIRTVEDFNLSLRTSTRVSEIFAKHVGISTVTMPATEQYDALSRGTVDGAIISIPDWTGYGVHELFTFALEGLNLGHFSYIWAMPKEKWDNFPEDVQQIMEDVAYEEVITGAELWLERDKETKEYLLEKGGQIGEFSELDPETRQVLEEGIINTWREWIEDLENRGEPGLEVAILWRDLIVELGGEVPEGVMELE